jgi:hypothetical protein
MDRYEIPYPMTAVLVIVGCLNVTSTMGVLVSAVIKLR